MEPNTRLVVGLGNPTATYTHTRHNAGRLFIDYLLKKSESTFQTVRQAEIFRLPNFFDIDLEKPLVCAQLDCFMNESGPPLKKLMEKENVKLEEVLVVYDDFMIPFGSLRLRAKGSAGGHNGIKSILETFGADTFGRLRIGIGPIPETDEAFNRFVLGKFTPDERNGLPSVFQAAQQGIKLLLSDGFSAAQNYLNKQHL